MDDKHKDDILFHFGFFAGSIIQDKGYTVTEVMEIVKDYCNENSK